MVMSLRNMGETMDVMHRISRLRKVESVPVIRTITCQRGRTQKKLTLKELRKNQNRKKGDYGRQGREIKMDQEVLDLRHAFVLAGGSVNRVLKAKDTFDLEDWQDLDFYCLPDDHELPLRTRDRIAAQRPKWKVRAEEVVEDGYTIKTDKLVMVTEKPLGRQPKQSWKTKRFVQHFPVQDARGDDGYPTKTKMRTARGSRRWRDQDLFDLNRENDLCDVGLRTLFMDHHDAKDFWAMVEDPKWEKWCREEERKKNKGAIHPTWEDDEFLTELPIYKNQERGDVVNLPAIITLAFADFNKDLFNEWTRSFETGSEDQPDLEDWDDDDLESEGDFEEDDLDRSRNSADEEWSE